MSKIFDRFVTFVCGQALRKPFVWLMAALIVSIPAVLQFSRVGLDTDLIRLLPENSRASILKKKMDDITTGSGGVRIEVVGHTKLEKLDGDSFWAVPIYETGAGKVQSWRLGGTLADKLGLSN